MKKSQLIKISAILWFIWGAVHVLAGVLTISADTAGSVAGIADAVHLESLKMNYHTAVGAIINQHGFNLAWIGTVTFIGGFFILKGSVTAIFISALVGGLTDIGYFLFMDLGGFVHFAPGTVMTIICAFAIITSFYAHFKLEDN
jgi:hypothetical protein